MKIIGSVLDFEAISTRLKFFTRRQGGYLEFKVLIDDTMILSNKIKVDTFRKLFKKMQKINADLSRDEG